MKTILSEQIGISLDPSAGIGLCPAVQIFEVEGGSLPTALSMVTRHLDFAEDTSIEVAQQQANQIATSLLHRLDTDIFQSADTSGGHGSAHLAKAIESINTEAVESGAYYSVLAAQLSTNRLLACGIGYTHGWLLRQGQIQRVLKPTVWPVSSSNPQASILNAALGIGFRADSIQSIDIHLQPADRVWLTLWTERYEFDEQQHISGLFTSEKMDTLLDRTLANFPTKPSVVAVIRPG